MLFYNSQIVQKSQPLACAISSQVQNAGSSSENKTVSKSMSIASMLQVNNHFFIIIYLLSFVFLSSAFLRAWNRLRLHYRKAPKGLNCFILRLIGCVFLPLFLLLRLLRKYPPTVPNLPLEYFRYHSQ